MKNRGTAQAGQPRGSVYNVFPRAVGGERRERGRLGGLVRRRGARRPAAARAAAARAGTSLKVPKPPVSDGGMGQTLGELAAAALADALGRRDAALSEETRR